MINRGSEWTRWDPHIHAPGTLHEDRFDCTWDEYLKAIESARPVIRALGITDYLVLRTYKKLQASIEEGRLQQVDFVFPNVEMRLDVATASDRFVNAHLLFSPHAPDHVEQIERILARLTFQYQNSTYACSEPDLMRLGRSIDPTQSDDLGALKVGAGQFKVAATQIRQLYADESDWMRENCLVAISGSGVDGISGIRNLAFKAVQQEIGRLAHVIFSGNPSDRAFWLGEKRDIAPEQVKASYRSLKPCLHGSDAHDLERLAAPEGDRYCWLLADLSFDGLKQVVMEPARRVFVGAEAPASATPSQTIDAIVFKDADWVGPKSVPLNPGLVAVIGARGSGKTALADMIARGADAMGTDLGEASFIGRADGLLGRASARVAWADGSAETRGLRLSASSAEGPPKVRYLSQRFVETLCSSDGVATALLKEIEAVIFHATTETGRLGAARFNELRDLKVATAHQRRGHLVSDIAELSAKWASDQELRVQRPGKEKTLSDIGGRVTKIEQELKQLAGKGDKARAERLTKLQTACATVSEGIQSNEAALERLRQLEVQVRRALAKGSETVADWQVDFATVGIPNDAWGDFRLSYEGDPGAVIKSVRVAINAKTKALRVGPVPAPPPGSSGEPPLDTWPLSALVAEREKVEKLVGLDTTRSRQYQQLQRELVAKKLAVRRIGEEIAHIKGAPDRQAKCLAKRRTAYAAVFQTLVEEQEILEGLYEPLTARLKGSDGTLGGLEFVVRRRVDLDAWVLAGEGLFDLRQATQLKGRGRLNEVARDVLLDVWQQGNAEAVEVAMSTFIERHAKEIVSARLVETGESLVDWYGRMAAWLFTTDHVRLEYSVRYAGTEIERLSPGMRGIVLLILYLAVDEWDTRPLVVDQPEDNLDPKSVFTELVRFFREARLRRQIILVTHNANLVVNADADQVIVAEAKQVVAGALPTIRYSGGGLDEQRIRDHVCDLLEGGKEAFRERERRYRMSASV